MQAGFTKAKEIFEAERELVAGTMYSTASRFLAPYMKGSAGRFCRVTKQEGNRTHPHEITQR